MDYNRERLHKRIAFLNHIRRLPRLCEFSNYNVYGMDIKTTFVSYFVCHVVYT